MSNKELPRILVIDDAYGRPFRDRRNTDREDLCVRMGLKDITGDEVGKGAPETIRDPLAEVVFCRGQVETGRSVENDLPRTLEVVRRGWEQWPRWALVLLDLHFKTGLIGPEGEPQGRPSDENLSSYFGLTILEHLWKDLSLRDIPIVILSSMQRDAIERRFADQGVWDFVDKTEINREKLHDLLIAYGLLEDKHLIGHSLPLLKCLREARNRARRGNDNILILGETGVGKELLAHYIHKQSGRKGAVVTLFTQGVAETLIEDRLFGHVKGAYSGANSSEPGAAELADSGTLFIDEFGDMPATIQMKLLRLLDKNIRETQRSGSQQVKKLDLQVVMSTNRLDILSVANGDFRRDILFRVGAKDPITLPPLRERVEDIPLLVDFFVRKYEKTFGAESRTVSEEALEALTAYAWPGNVRELEYIIERAVSSYRRLRSLSKAHLNFGASAVIPLAGSPVFPPPAQVEALTTIPHTPSSETYDGPIPQDIDALIKILDTYVFDENYSNLYGRLPDLQKGYARFLARYIRAALIATLDKSPEYPEGIINFTGALRCIMGDSELTTTSAKRLMGVRLFKAMFKTGVTSEDLMDILQDPFFRTAYDYALKE
jgi:transcriptional regulator with AAA-type ATPase domain